MSLALGACFRTRTGLPVEPDVLTDTYSIALDPGSHTEEKSLVF